MVTSYGSVNTYHQVLTAWRVSEKENLGSQQLHSSSSVKGTVWRSPPTLTEGVWTWSQSVVILTSIDPYFRYHTADPRRRSQCTDWRQLMNLSTSPPVSLPQGPSLHHLHLIGFLSRQMVTSRTQMMTIINYVYSRHPLCESKKKIIMLCQSRTWLKVKTKKKTNWLKLRVNPLGLQDNWLKR